MDSRSRGAAACAACRYQRRRCTAECPLAAYFPAERAEQFRRVHRLFGVCNVLRILKRVKEPAKRAEAMMSVVYEAEARHMDPVHGITGHVTALRHHLRRLRLRLQAIYLLLEQYQNQYYAAINISPLHNHNDAAYSFPLEFEVPHLPTIHSNYEGHDYSSPHCHSLQASTADVAAMDIYIAEQLKQQQQMISLSNQLMTQSSSCSSSVFDDGITVNSNAPRGSNFDVGCMSAAAVATSTNFESISDPLLIDISTATPPANSNYAMDVDPQLLLRSHSNSYPLWRTPHQLYNECHSPAAAASRTQHVPFSGDLEATAANPQYTNEQL